MDINKELTIIIKTFEREKSLKKMLASMVNTGIINYQILILDDSKFNYKDKILKEFKNKLNIEYIVTDFDIGLSKGRNLLLNLVRTPYFLLCDDDYRFDERCCLIEALNLLKEKNIDIIGGKVLNRYTINNFYELFLTLRHPRRFLNFILKKEEVSLFLGKFYIENEKLILKRNKDEEENTEIVSNFFIANTEKIKNIDGWMEELKMGEHEEFFYRAKINNLKIAFCSKLEIKHYPIRTYKYQKYRKRVNNEKIWLKRYGFKDLEVIF